jgi:hypothetical protein
MNETAREDGGTALALYIELGAWLDPKLTEDDKRIVLDIIKRRVIDHPLTPKDTKTR